MPLKWVQNKKDKNLGGVSVLHLMRAHIDFLQALNERIMKMFSDFFKVF